MTDLEILDEIARLQDVQMANSPKSNVWEDASVKLNKLFAVMAERHPSNDDGGRTRIGNTPDDECEVCHMQGEHCICR